MKTENEVYEICDMVKPYIQRIVKDIGDLGIGLAVSSDGGELVLYEQDKNVIHEHHMILDSDMSASGWNVNHQFTREEVDEYHQIIDQRFNQMMGTDQWGGFVGVIQ